jgi:hypothetical protein|tara:strand:- start:330 stop:440 length:111 start_codon:yes stop_codon:yes gene_type:complete
MLEVITFFGILIFMLPAMYFTIKGIIWISEKIEDKK